MKSTFIQLTAIFSLVTTLAFAQPQPEGAGQMRTNLYIVGPDKSLTLMDGTLTQYSQNYSNDFDGMDARKMSNFSENWGMLRNNTVYVIERRHTITDRDSIFFKMWNMRVITYEIEFIAKNLHYDDRQAVLVDRYLHTETPIQLNDTTRVRFAVTKDANSKMAERFTLIYSFPEKIPALSVTDLRGQALHRGAHITWQTEGYTKNAIFEIQRSVQGAAFKTVAQVPADSARTSYEWRDMQAETGWNNQYRIQIAAAGSDAVAQSETVSVFVEKVTEGLSVYPNPVKGKMVNITLTDEPKGNYTITLNNGFGLKIQSKTFRYQGGKQTEQLPVSASMMKGVYHLHVTGPDGYSKVISVLF